jgi:hypothetical protein
MFRLVVISMIVGAVLSVESPTACIASEAEELQTTQVTSSPAVDCQSVDLVSPEGLTQCPPRRP